MSIRNCQECGTAWEVGHYGEFGYMADCPRCTLSSVLHDLHGLLEYGDLSDADKTVKRPVKDIFWRYAEAAFYFMPFSDDL